MQSMVLLAWKTCAFIFHVTKLKQIFGIICGLKNTSLTTVSYIYITVPLSTVSSVNPAVLRSSICSVHGKDRTPGGALPYLGYTGTCRWIGYGFFASLS